MNFSNLIKHLDAKGRQKARQYMKFLAWCNRIPFGSRVMRRLGNWYFLQVIR